MLDSKEFVDIRFQEEARHKKPVGIYWLQSLSMGLIGGDPTKIWKYRLVSFFGATLSVLLTFWMARTFLSNGGAFFTALLFASTILIGVEAHIAKTDAALLSLIVAAQGLLARLWRDEHPHGTGLALLFWMCLGAGILVKGPIILLVSGGTVAALSLWDRNLRWLKRLRPLSGILVMAVIAVPWYVAIGLRTEGAFFQEAIAKDFLGKIASGQESHGAPPGVHTVAMLATFWPASALLVMFLPNLRAALNRPEIKFALCWAVPTWLVFELTATKLPHYVLPVFPALALLVWVLIGEAGDRPPKKWLLRLSAFWLALVPILIFTGSVVVPIILNNPIVWPATILLAGAGGVGILAAKSLLRLNFPKTVILAAVATALISSGAYGLALPQLPALWISSEIVTAAKRGSKCESPRIVSVGWREPSLVFLAGTETALRTAESALDGAGSGACLVYAVEHRQSERFLAVADQSGLLLGSIGVVEGFALNGGDRISMTLYQKTGSQ